MSTPNPQMDAWVVEFGEQLRATRERAGLTRSKLARLLDIPEQSVKNWETARSLPNLVNYGRLRRVLPDLPMPPYRSGKSKRVPRMTSPVQPPLAAIVQ